MWPVQQDVKFTEVWHIMWFFAVLWFDFTHTQTHKHRHKDPQHIQTNRLSRPYILTPSAMCSQQLSLLHWIIYWYQFFFQCLFFNYLLVEVVYLYIRRNKTLLFLWNTNNTDKNGVNKQNTHTHQTLRERQHWKGWWGSNYEPDCFWSFVFDSAKEASNDITTFLNLRFITKQKLSIFWENITCYKSTSS